MTHVFVSYSRRDKAIAGRIVRRLRRHGIETWFDEGSIPIGTIFARSIEDGIRDSTATIFIISEASLGSKWCRREYDWTLENRKTLVPVLVEAVDARLNWLDARQRIDLVEHHEGELFDLGIYEIVKALHVEAPGLVSNEALDAANRRVGWSEIDEKIEDLRNYAQKAEDYLAGITPQPGKDMPSFSAGTSRGDGEKLARFALGGIRDSQIAAHASQLIARTGNFYALERVGAATASPETRAQAFNALAEVLRLRKGAAPRVVPWSAFPRFLRETGLRNLRAGTTRWKALGCLAAGILALCYVSFISFGPDHSVRPLARLGHMISGAAYGGLLGIGIALSAAVCPKLYALGRARHLIGALLGWVFAAGAFLFYNAYIYYRTIVETRDTVLGLSALMISGFVLQGMLGRMPGAAGAGIAFSLCFLGAAFALGMTCGWQPFYPRLLAFASESCVANSVTTAGLLALGPILPALWLAVADAGHIRFSPAPTGNSTR